MVRKVTGAKKLIPRWLAIKGWRAETVTRDRKSVV